MKKYTNLIVLGVIALAVAVFLVARFVDFNDILLSIGFYEQKINIVNTSDVHGHIVYDDDVGGYYSQDDVSIIMGLPLIRHFVNEIREKDNNTLFFDCGDMFHGTNEANIEKGKPVVEVANLMGYNAMVPGNHDFNYGFERLLEIRDQLNYPMLSANIYRNGKLAFDEYKIFKAGDKKIGVFGLTTQLALSYTNSDNNDGIEIRDPLEAAKRVVQILKEQADVVILISHLGDTDDKQVIQEVDGIDLVLGGHYHMLYKKPVKINNTYEVEAGGWTTHVGATSMYFRKGKLAKITWSTKTSRNEELADNESNAIAQKYHKIALENAKEVVGKTTVNLDGIRSHVRSSETNLANLLADAMRSTGKADIAFMNGGGIRESIPPGDISLYKIGKVLPFSNQLVVIEVSGDKISSAIERGLRSFTSGMDGSFPQVSGMSYVIDGSKPAGKRLVSVEKDGKPLQKDKVYKLATNDYLFHGGDNYVEFKGAKVVSMHGLLKDVLAQYIREKGEVAPGLEDRIKVVRKRYN